MLIVQPFHLIIRAPAFGGESCFREGREVEYVQTPAETAEPFAHADATLECDPCVVRRERRTFDVLMDDAHSTGGDIASTR